MAEGDFDRDTAVREIERDGDRTAFDAAVADGWRAGRGPHGGYLAAMILRALMASVPDRLRAPRSLTIHFARAPEPGPVSITTVVERAGRSLNTLSARMEQDGRLMALALSAFSVPWTGPEISELQMPVVAAPDPVRTPGTLIQENGPPFASRIVLQHRLGGLPFAPGEQPMETGGWLGLAQPRAVDALSLAFYADALIPAPFMRMQSPAPAPTIDLTVHFRTATPRTADPDPNELCLAHTRARLLHEGFFEEDVVIWAPDGTVLAQSRQLAILLPGEVG